MGLADRGHPNFELVRHDVVDPFMIECDQIYHLACPASPIAYQYKSAFPLLSLQPT